MTWVLAFFAIVVLAPAFAAADDSNRSVSAADLVSKIIEHDEAIFQARSVFLRFKGTWTRRTDLVREAAADGRRAYQSAEDAAKLKPKSMELLELAFDENRIRRLTVSANNQLDLRVWDGSRVIIHERYEKSNQEHYAFDASPNNLIGGLFTTDLSSWRMGSPNAWFLPQYPPAVLAQVHGEPQDYTITGDAEFRNRKCLLLENRKVRRRLYVGRDDHRLYGIVSLYLPTEPEFDELAVAEQVLGRKFTSQEELKQATLDMPAGEREAVKKKFDEALWNLNRPLFEHYLDDYQELAPGIPFPRQQGYAIYQTSKGETQVETRRDLKLVDFKINEPLDDELFRNEIPNGAKVFDWRHDPPLQYNYDSQRTKEDFQKIVEDARNSNDVWKNEQKARDTLVGQPAPEFDDAVRLGGEPIEWQTLRGSVTVLVFWAHRLGACHDTLRLLQSHVDAHTNDGLTAIGVHVPSTEHAKIKAKLDKLGVTFTSVVDAPVFDRHGVSGALAGQCHIKHLPFIMVVDRDGKVAAIGEPADALPKALELLEQQAKAVD